LKHSFAAGIGLFLAFIGLFETGIVARAAEVPVQIGKLHEPRVLLAIFGFVLTAVLMCWRVRASILLGIVVTAAAGCLLGHAEVPRQVVALPFTGEHDLRPIALQLDVRGALRLSFLPVLLTLFLMSF